VIISFVTAASGIHKPAVGSRRSSMNLLVAVIPLIVVALWAGFVAFCLKRQGTAQNWNSGQRQVPRTTELLDTLARHRPSSGCARYNLP
jgi:hypothetical protein